MALRRRIFAWAYDRQTAAIERAGLAAVRRELLADLDGAVLEVGGGTGANLEHYGDGVRSLTVTEPDPHMLRRLVARAGARVPRATVVQAPAQDLPFDDASFDAVVSTLVLCGVGDQRDALAEVRRVLRPGGSLVLVEHVRSDTPGLARTQDRLNPVNRFLVGCECNRSTLRALEDAGFDVDRVVPTSMPGVPRYLRPAIVGTAVAPATASPDR